MESLAALLYAGHPYGVRSKARSAASGRCGGRRRRIPRRPVHARNADLGLAGGYDSGFVERVRRDLAGLPVAARRAPSSPSRDPAKASKCSSSPSPPAPGRSQSDIRSRSHAPPTIYSAALGELLLRRASDIQRRAHDEDALRPRAELRRLQLRRALRAGWGVDLRAANVPRRRQAFTIWIRPVAAEHAHFAIRLAVRELAPPRPGGIVRSCFRGDALVPPQLQQALDTDAGAPSRLRDGRGVLRREEPGGRAGRKASAHDSRRRHRAVKKHLSSRISDRG